jgi:hypothetical protein
MSIFGEVISAHSRAQAIEDGDLIDISDTAAGKCFKFPMAVTAAVYSVLQDDTSTSDSVSGRLWDMANIMMMAARTANGRQRIDFKIKMGGRVHDLYMSIGPGDTAAPVLTILMSGED